MLGQSVRLQPVPIQSLSELERARLQDVACYHLEKRDLDFNISIPRGTELIGLVLCGHARKDRQRYVYEAGLSPDNKGFWGLNLEEKDLIISVPRSTEEGVAVHIWPC